MTYWDGEGEEGIERGKTKMGVTPRTKWSQPAAGSIAVVSVS
jgi:hypothetical protein